MHIALATDGSVNGNAGVDLLVGEPARPGDQVSVLVVQPNHAFPGGGLTAPATAGGSGDRAGDIAAAQSIRLSSAGYGVANVILHGDPADEIVRSTQDLSPDLIVMGVKGHSMLRRMLVGSVSAAVARRAVAPVLLTREPVSLKRMLVVSDNSPESVHAAAIAGQIPAALLQQVTLLHVNPGGADATPIRAVFDATTSALSGAGIQVERQERTGNEVEVALHVAREMGATLIVVAASDAQYDGEPVLGTTARGLLEQAKASILIAR